MLAGHADDDDEEDGDDDEETFSPDVVGQGW